MTEQLTETRVVGGITEAADAAQRLVYRSTPFLMTPLPFNNFEFRLKPEAVGRFDALRYAPANPEEEDE